MARVRQFANDLGINYNQAKDLINKGRSRKDGGSQILEKTMNKAKPIKAAKGKFPDLSGDGKTTMKDILIGRGVIEKPQNKAGGGMPKMPKYRDGGAFRGCGAQVKGKKFKGIF
tara:strand:- start:928 stop:1269 length:342 start_codon:yes stop_codon:yes gene_type:complete